MAILADLRRKLLGRKGASNSLGPWLDTYPETLVIDRAFMRDQWANPLFFRSFVDLDKFNEKGVISGVLDTVLPDHDRETDELKLPFATSWSPGVWLSLSLLEENGKYTTIEEFDDRVELSFEHTYGND